MTQTKSKKQKNQQTPKNKGEIVLCWCDNGTTDGKFTEGIVYTALTTDAPVVSALRVQGNQIGRQRQNAFDFWLDKTNFEWVLWIDSDIVMTKEVLEALWHWADAKERPVISGTYFISKENERSLMTPYPALFGFTDDQYTIAYIHPLPKNVVIQVGAAGFGCLLMHRSVGEKMRKFHGDKPFFNETGTGEKFISEDINFFRLMYQAGIPLHAHTGATVQHMKRFALDVNYYNKIHEADTRTQA